MATKIDLIDELYIQPILAWIQTLANRSISYHHYRICKNNEIDIYFQQPNIILHLDGSENPKTLAKIILYFDQIID